jgi:primosomal protein N' (replication factor Y)
MSGETILTGSVSICIDRPVLSLDRPFTYDLPEELGAGVGSLVAVPFHGGLVRGWVLGPTGDVPKRMLRVKKLVSPVRFFDERMLELVLWVSERYVAPLASVIARSHPPRVASEDARSHLGGPAGARSAGHAPPVPGSASTAGEPANLPPASAAGPKGPGLPSRYRGGAALVAALGRGSGAFVLRPGPADEHRLTVDAVAATLAGGRSAVVLVPEVDPFPATARAVADAFPERTVLFIGGSKRSRYRMWLDIQGAEGIVVVGSRPAVFAPLEDLGLLYVARESHVGHREERSPYYHVRDVALARARIENAVCVMSALCPSAEAVVTGSPAVVPSSRSWPPVEIVRPGPEGRAPRLVSVLKVAHRGFIFSPLPGYGVARVCRACGDPAACPACAGMLRVQSGAVRCIVCGAEGRCANCGAADFGIAKRGAERVEEWAARASTVPVRRIGPGDPPMARGMKEVVVGGPDAVRDVGALDLDLVGILDTDLAARRPGVAAQERALATWMEAAAWTGPGGRVIVQTMHPGEPAVQSLVTGNPDRFYRSELPRRAAAGFPAGWPVFRVAGGSDLQAELAALGPGTILTSAGESETVCLLALEPQRIPSFSRAVRALAGRGVVTRVEAEPHW